MPTAGGAALPGHDVTREPLVRMVDEKTPPTTISAYQNTERARAELASGTTDRAIALLDEAVVLAPQAVPPYVVRARAYLAEGSTDLARSDLARAAKLSPDRAWTAEIIALTGATEEAEGNRDAAIESYTRAVVLFPGNQTARDALRRLAPP